jgi:antitoxin MazE
MMRVQFAKWGDSVALRMPGPLMREIGAGDGTSATIVVKDGSLIITPVADASTYDLSHLLDAISDENIHGEIETGDPVGNEFK